MQWHASARVHSRFEFQVVHSNQGTTMTTDQKGILIFSHLILKLSTKPTRIAHIFLENRVLEKPFTNHCN